MHPLSSAVQQHKVDQVNALIASGADPALEDDDTHDTAFHHAARDQTGEMMALLATATFSIGNLEKINLNRETAVSIAASRGNVIAFKILQALGADIHANFALEEAAKGNRVSIIELFSNSTSREELSLAFFKACKADRLAACLALLAKGADPFFPRNRSNSIGLHIAAMKGHLAIVHLYGFWRDRIDTAQSGSVTAFFFACQGGHVEVCKFLLQRGCNPNAKMQPQGYSPLFVATAYNRLEVIKLFRNMPEVLNGQTAESETALFVACQEGYREAAQLLLEIGADPRIPCGPEKQKRTCLHQAAESGHSAVLELFRGNNLIDVDVLDEDDRTPFHYACARGQLDAALTLLTMGARADAITRTEQATALHIVCETGKHNMVALLKDLIDKRDCYGYLALDIAAREGHSKTVAELLRHGATIRSLPRNRVYSQKIVNIFCAHQRRCLGHWRELQQDALISLLFDQEVLEERFGVEWPPLCDTIKGQIDEITFAQMRVEYLFSTLTIKNNTPRKALSAQEFDETPLEELLQSYFNIKIGNKLRKNCIRSGLLQGSDLQLIGIDSSFSTQNYTDIVEAMQKRIYTLLVWQKYCTNTNLLEDIERVIQECKMMIERFGDNILLMNGLSLNNLPTIESIDRDTAKLLIDFFIFEKGDAVSSNLSFTGTASLSEYVLTEQGRHFSPYTIIGVEIDD